MENLNPAAGAETNPQEYYPGLESTEKKQQKELFKILLENAASLKEAGREQMKALMKEKKELAKEAKEQGGSHLGLELEDVDIDLIDEVGLALFDRLRIFETIKKWELDKENRKDFYAKYGPMVEGLLKSYYKHLQEKSAEGKVSDNDISYIAWLRNYAINSSAQDVEFKGRAV